MAVILPAVPGLRGLFGSLPGISQLPLDLGFSRLIVHDPPAATRFVSFAGISLRAAATLRVWFVLLRRISLMKFVSGGYFIVRDLLASAGFRVVLLCIYLSQLLLDLGEGLVVLLSRISLLPLTEFRALLFNIQTHCCCLCDTWGFVSTQQTPLPTSPLSLGELCSAKPKI